MGGNRIPSLVMLAAMLMRNIKDGITSVAVLMNCRIPCLQALATVRESFVVNAPAPTTMHLGQSCPKLFAIVTMRMRCGIVSYVALATMRQSSRKHLFATTAVVIDGTIIRKIALATMCKSLDVDNLAPAAMIMGYWIIDNLALTTMFVITRKFDATCCTMMQRTFSNWKLLLTVATMDLVVRSYNTAALTGFGAVGAMAVRRFVPTVLAMATMLLCWPYCDRMSLSTALKAVLSIDRIKVGMTESTMRSAVRCCL